MSAAHDVGVLVTTLVAGLPGSVIAIALVWTGEHSTKVEWTVSSVVLVVWIGAAVLAREQVSRPLLPERRVPSSQ